MKRKDPPVAQASPAKTPRHGEQGEEEDGRPWEMKAGMILEVKLRNFMCHEVSGSRFSWKIFHLDISELPLHS